MLSTAPRRPEHLVHSYAHHDAIGRKRSRSFGGPVAVPLSSAYSEPRSHRRSSSTNGRAPYHPTAGSGSGSSHGHGHGYERERGRHGSISRHHPDFASVVPADIASTLSDPYARGRTPPIPKESRPPASRRATWQAPPSSHFAPSLKIHRALACTARAPALFYDVTYAPSHLNILAPPPVVDSCVFHTAPVRPSAYARAYTRSPCDAAFRTRAAPRTADASRRAFGLGPLTNLDVLHAVYSALRTPASRREWDALGAGSATQKRVAEAYKRRCEVLGTQREWDAGVRRIDFLCGRTVLWGVECRADGVCELVLAKPQ
ncbi:hypothetical protein EW145_g1415 [Phellinidium pouzarii]|uniref:DUF6699 domain-containing protein n=1 Tax=Phellinidium pouzarii TaxID=167371 RepID=A0A4S4LEK6_9AGAM|nr:hypothetical protein EW145_g1415 [Phellinidium pouzarii]